MSKTFEVSDVQISDHKITTTNTINCIKSLSNKAPEAYSGVDDKLIQCSYHPLYEAVSTAYDFHYPLALSPDAVWLTIAQGLAKHINANAEELRHHFVDFEGKKILKANTSAFFQKGQNNDWTSMFGEFSKQLQEFIGKKRDLIVSGFSTTGIIEKAASELVLMDAMQSYFEYHCYTCCGIPNITLLGIKEDWENIKVRVQTMSEFNLDWWTEKLLPIIDEFINVFNGNVNTSFWQNIYHMRGGSGKPYSTGWINSLYPYLKDGKKNSFNNLSADELPGALSKVPFKWFCHGIEYDMEFVGGLIGLKQEEDFSIKPEFGWAVKDGD